MNKKMKLTVLTLAVSIASVSAFAAGFGVSGGQIKPQNSEASAVLKLLGQAQSNKTETPAPIVKERQTTVPKSMQVKAKAAPSKKGDTFGNTGLNKQAFTSVVRNMMPLSPAQIHTLRQLFSKSRKAAATYPGVPPRPTSTSVIVNLSPGATPPIIRLRAGFITSLVFIDSTGQPWPVQAYDVGDPKAFNIKWNQKGNTLLVQALDSYKSGNLAVMLKGKDTPIMITLMPGQRAVDYRVDLRIPGLGPKAKPVVNGLPSTGNPQLLTFLNGVPPNGAKTLHVTGGPAQAWTMKGHLFLRTRLNVVSPSWLATMSSPDGTHVFELTKTPVVLASQRGTIVKLQIEGL